MKKLTTNEFIVKAKKVHGDKYDYSLVEYIDAHQKVKIICPVHGVFEQVPNTHTSSKSGCLKCGGTDISNTIEFISKSQIVHDNKYIYTSVNYINAKTKVVIICKEHGEFVQTPNSHLKNAGCPSCNKERLLKNIETQKIGITKFIERSNIVHKNKYDYSLVEYKNCKVKVKIVCPEHGIFEQIPDHHYRGVGCPACSKYYGSFYDKDLYVFYDEKYDLMKIGASKQPEKRIKDISKGKDKVGLILLEKYEKCAHMEIILHKKYEKYRTSHILYEDGNTEWFKLTKDKLTEIDEFIKSYIV